MKVDCIPNGVPAPWRLEIPRAPEEKGLAPRPTAYYPEGPNNSKDAIPTGYLPHCSPQRHLARQGQVTQVGRESCSNLNHFPVGGELNYKTGILLDVGFQILVALIPGYCLL